MRKLSETGDVAEGANGAGLRNCSRVGAIESHGADVAGDTVNGRRNGGAPRAVVSLNALASGINKSLSDERAVVAGSADGTTRFSNQTTSVGPSTSGARILGGQGGAVGAVVAFDAQLGLSVVGCGAEILGVAEISRRASLAFRELRSIRVAAGSTAKLGGGSVGTVVADVAHAERRVGNDLAGRAVESTPAHRAGSGHGVGWAVAAANTWLAGEDATLTFTGTVATSSASGGNR